MADQICTGTGFCTSCLYSSPNLHPSQDWRWPMRDAAYACSISAAAPQRTRKGSPSLPLIHQKSAFDMANDTPIKCSLVAHIDPVIVRCEYNCCWSQVFCLLQALTTPRFVTLGTRMLADYAKKCQIDEFSVVVRVRRTRLRSRRFRKFLRPCVTWLWWITTTKLDWRLPLVSRTWVMPRSMTPLYLVLHAWWNLFDMLLLPPAVPNLAHRRALRTLAWRWWQLVDRSPRQICTVSFGIPRSWKLWWWYWKELKRMV